MQHRIEMSDKKATSIVSCLAILADSPHHSDYLRKCADKDYRYLVRKLNRAKRR